MMIMMHANFSKPANRRSRSWLSFIFTTGLRSLTIIFFFSGYCYSAEPRTSAISINPSSAQSSSRLTQPLQEKKPAPQKTLNDEDLVQRKEKIALLLPTSGPLSGAAQAIKEGFFAAKNQEEQNTHLTLEVQIYNTDEEAIVSLYQTAIEQGATIVVGPLEKEKVAELKELHDFPVPILALNYITEPSVSTIKDTAGQALPKPKDKGYFFQFGLSAEDEAEQIADQAILDGYQSAAVFFPDSEWGKRIAQSFIQRWRKQGGVVNASLLFSEPKKIAPDIKRLLAPKPRSDAAKLGLHRRQDIDFIFLLAMPDQARQIKPILNFYYAGDIPVYATSSLYTGLSDPDRDRDLNDLLFVDQPWMLESNDAMKVFAQTQWPNQFGQTARLRGLGIDAYRLQDQLKSLSSSAQRTIQGVTGQLTSDKTHKIHRRLSLAQIQNGIAELIQNASDEPTPLTQ